MQTWMRRTETMLIKKRNMKNYTSMTTGQTPHAVEDQVTRSKAS